jgi:hypothetical protein
MPKAAIHEQSNSFTPPNKIGPAQQFRSTAPAGNFPLSHEFYQTQFRAAIALGSNARHPF